ncbi:tripartite tricarboxylate transporter substrate binding protein [Pigmentiphaga sp.]|uniref:Bug family tripartite tricarboxylate transporter substrate binding protein n=1 Tax=Pigmentiphaga sp. TaxID=1977564 RepID=UPI0025E5AEB3|nr:tripartite tricarboxylate transporter substrate binding protein [Pigmentiphaga sp.]
MKFPISTLFLCGCLLAPALARAEPWPARPITITVGFSAGGSYDAMARKIAEGLQESLGQPVVVASKPGAGGIVMTQALARARPDGYQVGFTTSLNLTLDAHAGVVPFNAAGVEALASVARFQSVIVAGAEQPYDDMPGLIAYTRKKGFTQFGKQALVDELVIRGVMDSEHVEFNFIPYKGGVDVRLAAMQRQIDFGYVGAGYKPDVDAGRLKILATTAPDRLPAFPQVRTLKELGYPVSEESVALFLVPAGTPGDIKARLSDAIVKVAATPEFRSFLAQTLLLVPEARIGAGLKASLDAQEAQWTRLLAANRKTAKTQ